MDAKNSGMSNMLTILMNDFAYSHGFSPRECYPVLRVSDRKIYAIYVRDVGWFPYATVSIDRMK